MDKESIGHWWILRPRKDNAGNAFVYEGLGRGFRSSRSARYQFDANISLWPSRLHRRLKLADHLYEFSHGLRVHFLHCPAPMNLHGVFRSCELISNLLVEHA